MGTVYALEGSLQLMGYRTLGLTLVSTVSTQSFLIHDSTMPLEDTSYYQVGCE